MSKWQRSPIVLKSITRSDKFINKNGDHPKVMDTIDGDKIVLLKKDLKTNNWLFCTEGDKEKEMAIKQIDTLKFNGDWVIILE